MNRHDRRSARRLGCLAGFTAGLPPAHAPEDCDGTCHSAAEVSWVEAGRLLDEATRLRILCQFESALAEAVPEDASVGCALGALLVLGAAAMQELAAARDRAFWKFAQAIFGRFRGSAWARLRVLLEAHGILGRARCGADDVPAAQGTAHALYAVRSAIWLAGLHRELPVISP